MKHWIVLIFLISFLVDGHIFQPHHPNHHNPLHHSHHLHRLFQIRGGQQQQSATIPQQESQPTRSATTQQCNILISTSIGSSFLDKKKKVTLPANTTIAELKEYLQSKFPGSPPKELQHLYYGTRLLGDDEVVSNITTLPTIPLLLDMVSGHSIYDKTMSIEQALEGYVASVVQLTYLSNQLKTVIGYQPDDHNSNETITTKMESPTLRQLFQAVNRTIYETYADEIAYALEVEKDPEAFAADTKAWRSPQRRAVSPLTAALAKEFDLNLRSLCSFLYYTAILLVFANFGTSSAQNASIIFSIIPVLWLSKLRQLRLIYKIALYLILPVLPKMDIFMPLLPAPLQVMAVESQKWFAADASSNAEASNVEEEKENSEGEEDDDEDNQLTEEKDEETEEEADSSDSLNQDQKDDDEEEEGDDEEDEDDNKEEEEEQGEEEEEEEKEGKEEEGEEEEEVDEEEEEEEEE
eukprot:gene3763-4113_t